MTQEKIRGWRFLADDRKLKDEDGYVAEVGKTYTIEPPAVKRIEYGEDYGEYDEWDYRGIEVHARVIDALHYAQGNILCDIEASGDIDEEFPFDTVWATEVTVLQMVDVERALHRFSFSAMRGILRANNVTEEDCWEAIRYKEEWLHGNHTDRELSSVWARIRDKYGTQGWASNLDYFLNWKDGWLAARAVAEEHHNERLEEDITAELLNQAMMQSSRRDEFRKELLELMRKYDARLDYDIEYDGHDDPVDGDWYFYVDGCYLFLEDLRKVDE